MSELIPVKQIDPNPRNPRKTIDHDYIKSLAASIRKRGLIQPPTVRPKANGRYEIAKGGECRLRAHQYLVAHGYKGFAEMRCEVVEASDRECALAMVVENLKRRDMNPIDEAQGYQSLIADGMTVEQVCEELDLGRVLVQQRLDLLKLSPQIQKMVAAGQITAHVGFCVAMVPEERQAALVRDIGKGKYKTVDQIRHAAMALRDVAAQGDVFANLPKASPADRRALASLETRIEQVAKLVQSGFKDGECIAAKRVNPERVKKAADQLGLIRKHVYQMEHALRCAAAQGEILKEVA